MLIANWHETNQWFSHQCRNTATGAQFLFIETSHIQLLHHLRCPLRVRIQEHISMIQSERRMVRTRQDIIIIKRRSEENISLSGERGNEVEAFPRLKEVALVAEDVPSDPILTDIVLLDHDQDRE